MPLVRMASRFWLLRLFETGATDLSAQFSRIVALNPDAIFVSALPAGRAQALIDGAQHGIPILIPLLTIDEVARAGEAAEGAISFTVVEQHGQCTGQSRFY